MKMMNTIKRIAAGLLAGALLLSQTVCCAADGSPMPYADTLLPSGLTAAQFDEEMNELASANHNDTYGFASAEVGIFKGGDVIYTGYFGKVNYEENISADSESVYEWGSISKTLVWVSVMQLWEQGRIDLDRDVREYLPEGFFTHLTYDDPITMMNLMNHDAGWQETTRPIFVTDENKVQPLKEALKSCEPAQVNRPGEVVAYSNYGAAVAGYVVECITGMDYCEYVHKNIFEPLGMEHTALDPTHSDNEWVRQQREKSHSYGISSMYDSLIDYGSKLEYVPAYPAGAAAGTLADLMTYAQAFVDDSAPLFESPATQEKLFEGTCFYGNSDIPMCAHGFFCTEYAVRTYGHSGGTHFGQANMLFDRESKTGLVVMVNEKNGNAFLSMAPSLCMGSLSPDKYGTGSGSTFNPAESNYLISRAWHRGMFKFYTYVSSPVLTGNAEQIADGVYQLVNEYEGVKLATIIGVKKSSDGRLHIQQPSIEAISDKGYVAKLALLTVYSLTAVSACYMLRIRRRLKKAHRLKSIAGAGVITAAFRARLVSGLLLLCSFVAFYSGGGSIHTALAAVIGTAQAVCIGICGAGIVTALISLGAKPAEGAAVRAKPWQYIGHAAANALCIAAIVIFEMYRFTNM